MVIDPPLTKADLGIREMPAETKARMWTARERKRLPLFADLIPEHTAEEVVERDRLFREGIAERRTESRGRSRFCAAVALRMLRRSPVPRAVIRGWQRWLAGSHLRQLDETYWADFWHSRFREAFGTLAFRCLIELHYGSWIPESWHVDEPEICRLRAWRPGDAA